MDHADARPDTASYKIDSAAVAAAIVNRLLAGGALAPPRSGDGR